MIEAIRNLHALGASLEDAVDAATVVPARVLGRCHLGRIAIGGPADIVVLDDQLEVIEVLIDGQPQ
jgi:N-acetylglucosamine-6-phosphate deacetylase